MERFERILFFIFCCFSRSHISWWYCINVNISGNNLFYSFDPQMNWFNGMRYFNICFIHFVTSQILYILVWNMNVTIRLNFNCWMFLTWKEFKEVKKKFVKLDMNRTCIFKFTDRLKHMFVNRNYFLILRFSVNEMHYIIISFKCSQLFFWYFKWIN